MDIDAAGSNHIAIESIKSRIESQIIHFCYQMVNRHFDPEQPALANGDEQYRLNYDEAESVTSISYRLRLGDDDAWQNLKDKRPWENYPLLLDIWYDFWMEPPIRKEERAELVVTIREAIIRGRASAADLLYLMGGHEARELLVAMLHTKPEAEEDNVEVQPVPQAF